MLPSPFPLLGAEPVSVKMSVKMAVQLVVNEPVVFATTLQTLLQAMMLAASLDSRKKEQISAHVVRMEPRPKTCSQKLRP